MRFYTKQHKFYCGIDLHARSMYVCIINSDGDGDILVHKKLPADREKFLKTIAPYREDIVVAVECVFLWYWLADLCAKQDIEFVLGHALYMKAIHGGESSKNPCAKGRATQRFDWSAVLPHHYTRSRCSAPPPTL